MSIAPIFQQALGEPLRQALFLADTWRSNQQTFQKHFIETASVPINRSLEFSEQIEMIDGPLASHFIDSCNTGMVLATIHMGDYLHAILKLISMIKKRQILVVKHAAWSSADQSIQKLGSFGHEVTAVLNTSPDAAKKVIKALKSGSLVIMLYDLSYKWGATQPVCLFNNDLNWVSGPISLSLLSKCCLIPFFTFTEDDSTKCTLEPVRDYRHLKQNRRELLQPEVQLMATLAEKYIRSHVTQWHHWHLLPEMVQANPENRHSQNYCSVG